MGSAIIDPSKQSTRPPAVPRPPRAILRRAPKSVSLLPQFKQWNFRWSGMSPRPASTSFCNRRRRDGPPDQHAGAAVEHRPGKRRQAGEFGRRCVMPNLRHAREERIGGNGFEAHALLPGPAYKGMFMCRWSRAGGLRGNAVSLGWTDGPGASQRLPPQLSAASR